MWMRMVIPNTSQGDDSRYPFKLSPFSSHSRLLEIAGAGSGQRLLDVGCAQGDLTWRLQNKGWQTIGIEPDPNDAKIAVSRGLSVQICSAEEYFAMNPDTFDVIVFGDVLEHLPDPKALLRTASSRLRSGGRILVSLPNVAHLSVRLSLLFGSFQYQSRGILDETHLRFFTRSSTKELFRASGLSIVRLRTTPAPLELAFPWLASQAFYPHLDRLHARAAGVLSGPLAYQFVAELCLSGD